MNHQDSKELRQELRAKRRALSVKEQESAALALFQQVTALREFKSAKRIAFYLPSDSEINPTAILNFALAQGQECFLPVLHPLRKDQMLFVRYLTGDTLKANRWGILEPQLSKDNHVKPQSLDLVLVPLVGFDAQGGRLGMGKGFYDRAFAFKQRSSRRKPVLIGLAHECQRVAELNREEWDVPMDKIISDQQTYQP